MLIEISIAIALAVLWVALVKLHRPANSARRPPGPFQWPLIGNLPQIAAANAQYPHLAFSKLAKTYGDVVSIRFGVHNALLLSSYTAIRDLLGKEEFHGRFDGFPYSTDRSHGRAMGLIFTSGDNWRVLRRFTARGLREFGFGKRNSMDSVMGEELDDFFYSFESKATCDSPPRTRGRVTIVPELFMLSYINILWTYLAGYRFSHSDSRLPSIFRLNEDVIRTWNHGNWTAPFPILKYLLPGLQHVTNTTKLYNALHEFNIGLIRQLETDYKKESPGTPRTFIELFLQEIHDNDAKTKAKGEKGQSETFFTIEELNMVVQDLFLGGSETTSNATAYGLLYMVLHPEVQERIYNEISSNSNGNGNANIVSYTELLDKMPYTLATLEEILRCASVVPVPVPRVISEDVVYRGYKLPKGAAVFANNYAVHMDDEFWGDPGAFRPERFLDNSTGVLIKARTERVLAFGSGKRVCIAESMARESFALFFTGLLKRYKFELPPGDAGGKPQPPTKDPVPMFTLRPHPFDVLITPRNL